MAQFGNLESRTRKKRNTCVQKRMKKKPKKARIVNEPINCPEMWGFKTEMTCKQQRHAGIFTKINK